MNVKVVKGLINKIKQTAAHASKSFYVFIPLSVNIIKKKTIQIHSFPHSTDVSNRTMTHYEQSMNCHKQMLRTHSVLKMCKRH